VFATLRVAPISDALAQFITFMERLGLAGALPFAILFVIATLLLFPGTVLVLASGFIYGPFWGVLVVTPAMLITALLHFLLARSQARNLVAHKLASYPRLACLDRAIEHQGFKLVLLLRLQPVFIPTPYLSAGLGLTRVHLREYLLGSLVGMLPGIIAYVYLGSAFRTVSALVSGRISHNSMPNGWMVAAGVSLMLALLMFMGRVASRALKAASINEASQR
jgi:uncharacterized membrane protein YdjX (TVP38/TMEM64 family)